MADHELHPVIGELRAVRRAWKLSQTELGYKSGIGRTFISMVENGHVRASFVNVVQWADTLGYEIVLKPKF